MRRRTWRSFSVKRRSCKRRLSELMRSTRQRSRGRIGAPSRARGSQTLEIVPDNVPPEPGGGCRRIARQRRRGARGAHGAAADPAESHHQCRGRGARRRPRYGRTAILPRRSSANPPAQQLHPALQGRRRGHTAKETSSEFSTKGFSTKSRDTNYGIGLALVRQCDCGASVDESGRQAKDPGLGASMHLMVPLPIRET
jgi:hypothetical protein